MRKFACKRLYNLVISSDINPIDQEWAKEVLLEELGIPSNIDSQETEELDDLTKITILQNEVKKIKDDLTKITILQNEVKKIKDDLTKIKDLFREVLK